MLLFVPCDPTGVFTAMIPKPRVLHVDQGLIVNLDPFFITKLLSTMFPKKYAALKWFETLGKPLGFEGLPPGSLT